MTELSILALAVVLGFVHIVLASHAGSLQRGYRWTAGARDEPGLPLTGVAGRLERASRNFQETFPFFAAAVLIVVLAGRTNAFSLWGAYLYLGARVAYLIAYASGVFLVRSLIWNVAAVGIFLILFAAA
jgi:uncharacterized MAPEG superfamily protein